MTEEPQVKKCGDWTLEREIGRGAYGVVYLATNAGGETAAIKICLRDGVERDRYERELRGARLYKAIPPTEGLVRMLELAECEWGFYTVMELADDEFGESAGTESVYRPKTLSCVIAGERALPLKESVNLGLALAKGLETLQRHHLLHRDIKPGNILYVHGRPVLADPGLVVEETEAASLVGTPGYVPPEQFVNAGGDIYSLGLTLKAASFGRPVEELEKGPTLEADTGHPQFAAWWRILNKATDPDATRRYRSAKALLKDLDRIRLGMLVGRHLWVLWAGLGGAFMSVIAYAYGLERDRKRLIDEFEPLSKAMKAIGDLNEKSSQDDMVWSSFGGSYFCHTDESHMQRLKRVEERDPVRAAKMRVLLEDMQKIDKKGEENNRRIRELHDRKDGASSKDSVSRYNQAELLSMENEKLVKAWLSLLEQFTTLEDIGKFD